jgi:DNA-directed RNA polymerase specialized sigma24 family protein
MLRDSVGDQQAVWAAIEWHWEFIGRLVACRTNLHVRDDVHQDVALKLAERILTRDGLPVSEGRGNAEAWFGTVIRHLTTDWLRRASSAPDDAGALSRTWPIHSTPSTYDRLVRQLPERMERRGVRPHHTFAFLAFKFPEVLQEAHAASAADQHAGRDGGIKRDGQRTWELTEEWRAEHRIDSGSRKAREHMGWILRSQAEPPPPSSWIENNPQEAHRATNLVNAWSARACQRVLEGQHGA